MATFNTKKTIFASPSLIPEIANRIVQSFSSDGFEVVNNPFSSGGVDISISKGGMFKAVLGMKSALKVTLTPQCENIYFEAGVGIFGQQVVPSIISWFVFWPVLITQIWGMVEQAKLDDKALAIAEQVVNEASRGSFKSVASFQPNPNGDVSPLNKKFCTNCGSSISSDQKFCSNCGCKL